MASKTISSTYSSFTVSADGYYLENLGSVGGTAVSDGLTVGGIADTVVNAGTIIGASHAINANQGLNLTNQSGGTITGTGTGGFGVYVLGGAGTLTNDGRITGTSDGIVLAAGGTVTNQGGGRISGATAGVLLRGSAGLVDNAASIYGLTEAVDLADGGTVINRRLGNISSTGVGVLVGGAAGIVSNGGDIYGAGTGVGLTAGGTVTNQNGIYGGVFGIRVTGGAGTVINEAAIGGLTDAVLLAAGYANRVVADPNVLFNGRVDGGNTIGAAVASTLELASGASAGTIAALAAYLNFANVTVDSGATWTIGGTIGTGMTLDNAGTLGTAVTLSAGAALTNASGGQIGGPAISVGVTAAGAVTVVNAGGITGSGDGIGLSGGGSLDNLAGGTIQGGGNGAYFHGANGTLTNAGLIASALGTGVDIQSTIGAITNQAGGTISGYDFGAAFSDGVSLVNAGLITAYKDVVFAIAGGTITNQAGGSIVSTGADNFSGIRVNTAPATIINAGYIAGGANGIYLQRGGAVTNQSGGTISESGTIQGANNHYLGAIVSAQTNVLVSNAGLIQSFQGVILREGGGVTNLSGGTIDATGGEAVQILDLSGTLDNAGLIEGDEGASFGADASVINRTTGTIIANSLFEAGVDIGLGTLDNAGSIAGGVAGVVLGNGLLINESTGTISQSGGTFALNHYEGVFFSGGGTLINAGSISGQNAGIDLNKAGQVTNQSGGRISSTAGVGAYVYNETTLVNAGTISGGFYAVELATRHPSVTGQARLIVDPGATFVGTVQGNALAAPLFVSTLELASGASAGALSGLGSQYVGFTDIVVDNAAAWTVSGSLAAGYTVVTAGTLTNTGSIGSGVTLGGSGTMGVGGTLSGDGTLNNEAGGTIGGPGVTGTGTLVNAGMVDAVALTAGFPNRVVVDPGAAFSGTVDGGNRIGGPFVSTLELAAGGTAGTLPGIGTQFINFANIVVDSGAAWALTGTNSFAAGMTLTDQGTLSQDNGAATIAGSVLVSGGSWTGISGLEVDGALSIQGGGSVAAQNANEGSTGTIDLEGANSGLTIGGTLSIGGAVTVGAGATLGAASAIMIGGAGSFNTLGGEIDTGTLAHLSGGQASVLGLIDAADAVENTSTFTINGGTATFDAPVVLSGTSAADAAANINADGAAGVGFFRIGAGGTLVMNAGSVDAGQVIQFEAANAVLVVGQDPASGANGLPGFDAAIWGYTAGDKILFDNLTVGSDSVSGGTITLFDGAGDDLGSLTLFNGIGGPEADAVVQEAGRQIVACFAAGTRIATEQGPVAVERLAIGDRVMLASGGSDRVIWVGSRTVDCARHPRPETVWPVRVAAGAFGPGVPHRALFMSPDHAVFVSDVLVPVKFLINGTSIARTRRRSVTYHHVELTEHAVILAEGLSVESYLDGGDRADFGSEAGLMRLHPDFGARLNTPWLWETKGAAPLVTAGPELDQARRRVASYGSPRRCKNIMGGRA